MIVFLQIALLFLLAGTVLACKSVALAGPLAFLPMLVLTALPVLKAKRVLLVSAFSFAFVYMILPEAVLSESDLFVKWGQSHVLVGWRVLVLSYIAVYCGYLVFEKKTPKNDCAQSCLVSSPELLRRAKFSFFGLTIFLLVLFSPMIVYGLTTGRGSTSLYNPEDGGGLLFSVGPLGYFLGSLCYAVCGFWGYYFSRQGHGAAPLVKALGYSSPILLIGIASGTRFMLCFMFSCVLLPWIYKLTLRKLKWFAIGGLCLTVLFSAMKYSRGSGFDLSAGFQSEQTTGTAAERLAQHGSTEGLIRNMAMIDHWTSTHSYTYGKSIGFLGIFWIPRAIWHDKPTQIDYWLIREYEGGFGGGHSTASSFCGEWFMDFGYFCVLVCFALGGAMARMDVFIFKNLVRGGFVRTAFAGILLGWAFFMTRSFLTASYPLVLGVPVLWLLNKMFVKEKVLRIRPACPPPESGSSTQELFDRIFRNIFDTRGNAATFVGNGGAA